MKLRNTFFLVAVLGMMGILASCTHQEAPPSADVSGYLPPITMSGETISLPGGISQEELKKQEQIRRENQEKAAKNVAKILETSFDKCSSDEYKKITEAYISPADKRPKKEVQAAFQERCKIRAIIRENKECSILAPDAASVDRCEYVKKAEKEVQAFEEKKAVHDSLFWTGGNTKKTMPDLFSNW